MKPVIDDIKTYTPDRILDIRAFREKILSEDNPIFSKGGKSKSPRKKKEPKPVKLSAESQAILDKLDPEMRATMEAALRKRK